MTLRVDEISAVDWSPKLGSPGEVVTGTDDIEQCLHIILNTRKGTVPHRPLFGCDAWRFLDAPSHVAVPGIVNAVLDAVELWEPRITVVQVKVKISNAQVTVTIVWEPKSDAKARTKTEVQFDKAA